MSSKQIQFSYENSSPLTIEQSKARRERGRKSKFGWQGIGAVALSGVALVAISPNARDSVTHAFLGNSQAKEITLSYDSDADKDVFGFASRHLKGDPRSHLEELKAQLGGSYDVTDGQAFHVKDSELINPSDSEIVPSADG